MGLGVGPNNQKRDSMAALADLLVATSGGRTRPHYGKFFCVFAIRFIFKYSKTKNTPIVFRKIWRSLTLRKRSSILSCWRAQSVGPSKGLFVVGRPIVCQFIVYCRINLGTIR